MKSISQALAMSAYQNVQQIKLDGQEHPALLQAYGSLCHRFPSMVMLNGLRLTIAFFDAKGAGQGSITAKAYHAYISHIRQTLKIEGNSFDKMDSEYRLLSQRALQAVVWYKRYAEAILGVTEAQELEASDWGDQT